MLLGGEEEKDGAEALSSEGGVVSGIIGKLKQTGGLDLDRGLSSEDSADLEAYVALAESHLQTATLWAMWCDDQSYSEWTRVSKGSLSLSLSLSVTSQLTFYLFVFFLSFLQFALWFGIGVLFGNLSIPAEPHLFVETEKGSTLEDETSQPYNRRTGKFLVVCVSMCVCVVVGGGGWKTQHFSGCGMYLHTQSLTFAFICYCFSLSLSLSLSHVFCFHKRSWNLWKKHTRVSF